MKNTGLWVGLGIGALAIAGIAIASSGPSGNGNGNGGGPLNPQAPSGGVPSMEGNINFWPMQTWRQLLALGTNPETHPIVVVAYGPRSNSAVVEVVEGVLSGAAYVNPTVFFTSIPFAEIATAAEQLNGQLQFDSNNVKFSVVGAATPQGPIVQIQHDAPDISPDLVQSIIQDAIDGALQRSGGAPGNVLSALVRR